MSDKKIRVLCLDIEGGFGGSSRSLYYLLKHMDRSRFDIEVWCRKNGPVVERYHALGIPVFVEPSLPKMSALPRLSRSLWSLGQYCFDFLRSKPVRSRLVAAIQERFDVVHFNHEGFWLLARWMRPRVRAAFVVHNRTQLWNTIFARWQSKTILKSADACVYITEREQENMKALAGRADGEVIYNVVDLPQEGPRVPRNRVRPFNVACLANYSWLRGVDRIIDVAAALRSMGCEAVRFTVAGNCRVSGNIPGILGEIARKGGTLADYAAVKGVEDMICFTGHVNDPERILAEADLLLKPSREDNPWGRDILEGMSMGLPVMACGSFAKFVEPGVTGYLYSHDDGFDPMAVAQDLIGLEADPVLAFQLGQAARDRVGELCDGARQARRLGDVWRGAYSFLCVV